MELLIGKWHIFTNALLSETTLPWIPPIWIPEYLAGLMKLSESLAKGTRDSFVLVLTTRTSDDDSTFKGCCELCVSAISEFV